MQTKYWRLFALCTLLKVLLIPAYHSTDFEVHRNWLAITHSLPINRWYVDATSIWTLDYPPFFAYFEWLLAQLARHVHPQMLELHNLNYASWQTKYFQRYTVMAADLLLAIALLSCLRALRIAKDTKQHLAAEILLLFNVGLIFVDHIHFQYNGFLFGMLLLSASFLLQQRYLLAAFSFAALLNFKHIFLYVAPAYAAYLLKFYCLQQPTLLSKLQSSLKLLLVGLLPFVLAFAPFWQQIPQVLSRLFPFKRGLTHAYWAPNFWALYNAADKLLIAVNQLPKAEGVVSSSSGLVQEVKHVVLPNITPFMTFALTVFAMLPVLIKLYFFTKKSDSKLVFLRALVLCSCASFMFGWHVHEKAILMTLIPICLLCLLNVNDARYALLLSVPGYWSLFPLLFDVDLFLIRYTLYMAYIAMMYVQISAVHKTYPKLYLWEKLYACGFLALPIYEHIIAVAFGLDEKWPFMTLLLTSVYCSLGVLYFFVLYYIHTLNIIVNVKRLLDYALQLFGTKRKSMAKSKVNGRIKHKFK